MEPRPSFIQGVYSFEGKGLASPVSLIPAAQYSVPSDKRVQVVYVRAGNATQRLVCLTLARDGKAMRLFPIGAQSSVHVSLAVVEDVFPESKLEVLLSAAAGERGEVVLDVGFLEID